MVSDRTRDLLMPITILVSVGVGAVVGASFVRAGTADRSNVDPTLADSKTLVTSIDALRDEVERLRARIETSASAASSPERSQSRTAVPAPDTTNDLRAATAQLVEAADTLRHAASRSSGDRAPLVMPRSVDPKHLQKVLTQDNDQNKKTYLLWTYQQVIDVFGPPSQVGREEGGVYWQYRSGSDSVLFHFADGRVFEVDH